MGFQYMLPSFLSYLNIYNLGNSIIFPMEGQSTDYIMKQIHKANSLLKCRLKSLFMWTGKVSSIETCSGSTFFESW